MEHRYECPHCRHVTSVRIRTDPAGPRFIRLQQRPCRILVPLVANLQRVVHFIDDCRRGGVAITNVEVQRIAVLAIAFVNRSVVHHHSIQMPGHDDIPRGAPGRRFVPGQGVTHRKIVAGCLFPVVTGQAPFDMALLRRRGFRVGSRSVAQRVTGLLELRILIALERLAKRDPIAAVQAQRMLVSDIDEVLVIIAVEAAGHALLAGLRSLVGIRAVQVNGSLSELRRKGYALTVQPEGVAHRVARRVVGVVFGGHVNVVLHIRAVHGRRTAHVQREVDFDIAARFDLARHLKGDGMLPVNP